MRNNPWRLWLLIVSMLGCASAERNHPPYFESFTVNHAGNSFECIRVDSTDRIRFDWKSSEGAVLETFKGFRDEVKRDGDSLYWCTNGGMFNRAQYPIGYYVEHGVEFHKVERDSGYGNFHLLPNGIFAITSQGEPFVVQTDSFDRSANKLRYATQSGPMLVIDGQIHPAFNLGSKNKHIRSGVGINDKGQVIFAISNKTSNFHDFATLFRDSLHCNNALYLDGAISKMYNPQTGRNEDGWFGVMIGIVGK